MPDDTSLIPTLPRPQDIHRRLGDAVREVQLLRKLLRLSQQVVEHQRLGRHIRSSAGEAHGD
jgi:hypothetical protein